MGRASVQGGAHSCEPFHTECFGVAVGRSERSLHSSRGEGCGMLPGGKSAPRWRVRWVSSVHDVRSVLGGE